MNFLADENIDSQIVQQLRDEGYTVLYVRELEPGISDDQVLDLANQVSAILITNDKDFGELVFRLRKINSGVILLRLSGLSSLAKSQTLLMVINQYSTEINESFTVVRPDKIKIRQSF